MTYLDLILIILLYTRALEPSAALPRLLKVTPAVYPHLNDFTGKNFVVKVDPLNLESQNQANNITVGLPSSPIKIWGKLV